MKLVNRYELFRSVMSIKGNKQKEQCSKGFIKTHRQKENACYS